MRQLRLLVILAPFFLQACTATLVEYNASSRMETKQALIAIENIINNNPDRKNISVDLLNERFIRLQGRLPGGVSTKNIPYRVISRIDLHTKRDWYIVSVFNKFDQLEYRYLGKNEQNAKSLIDALTTLQNHKPSQYSGETLQVTHGGDIQTVPSRMDMMQLKTENEKLKQKLETIQNNVVDTLLPQEQTTTITAAPVKNLKTSTWQKQNIDVSHDDFEGITWYRDANAVGTYKTRLITEFAEKKSNNRWLRMKIRYYANDWLFIHSYIVKADEHKFTFNNRNFNRDNGSGSIWEWETVKAGKKEIEMLKAVATSDKTVIRFYGRQYYSDHTVSVEEKDGIKRILSAYYEK